MGKRGPLPKKRHLKKISRMALTKENLETLNIALQTDAPDPPEHLSADELKIWHETTALLKPIGTLNRVDAAVLASYCCSYVRWKDSEVEISKMAKRNKLYSIISEGANGQMVVNPLVNVSRRERADMITYASQLGMTPAARMRIESHPQKHDDNPFAELKKRKDGELDKNSDRLRRVSSSQKK